MSIFRYMILAMIVLCRCADDVEEVKCAKECCVVHVGEKKTVNGMTPSNGKSVCYDLRLEANTWYKDKVKDLDESNEIEIDWNMYSYKLVDREDEYSLPYGDFGYVEFNTCAEYTRLFVYVSPVIDDDGESEPPYDFPNDPFRYTIEKFPGYNDGFYKCEMNLGDPPIYKFAGRVGYYWAKIENESFYTFNKIEDHYYLITIENSSGEYEIGIGRELIKTIEPTDLLKRSFVYPGVMKNFSFITNEKSGITYEISIEDLGTTPP